MSLTFILINSRRNPLAGLYGSPGGMRAAHPVSRHARAVEVFPAVRT